MNQENASEMNFNLQTNDEATDQEHYAEEQPLQSPNSEAK